MYICNSCCPCNCPCGVCPGRIRFNVCLSGMINCSNNNFFTLFLGSPENQSFSLLPSTNVVCEGYIFTGVCDSVNGGACVVLFGGACVVLFGGACVVLFGGCAWFYSGGAWFYLGGHAWFYSGGHAWFYSGGCAWFFQFFQIQ